MLAWLVILIPIILLAMAISVVVALVRKDGENFERKIRAIYLYIVALASLVIIIGSVIVAVTSITNYALPEERSYYQNYTDEYKAIAQYNDRIGSMREFIVSIGTLVIILPVFLYHNKKALALKNK